MTKADKYCFVSNTGYISPYNVHSILSLNMTTLRELKLSEERNFDSSEQIHVFPLELKHQLSRL